MVAAPFSSTDGRLPVVERARRYLAALPAAETGQRGHDTTFRAACVLLQGFALGEDTVYALLAAEFNPRCRPPWSAADLGHKVRSAAGTSSNLPRGYLLGGPMDASPCTLPGAAPKWPVLDEASRAEVINTGPDAATFCELSPLAFEDADGTHAATILEQLFSTAAVPDPLLCVGRSNAEFATRALSTWINSDKLPGAALIVPSPMRSRLGRTKDGRESEHTLESTGPRRFLVVEFDQGTTDAHAALLWHLAGFAPLALAVHSGGKSLHGWFYSQGQPENGLRRFMAYAVSLGADRATWTRSQFVRLPDGRRENGARQSVFYFDPSIFTGKDAEHEQ